MKVQYWWFSQPRAAPWTTPKCLDPSHRANQNNKRRGTVRLVLYQSTQEPHGSVKVLPIYVRKSHTSHKHTHIAKTHQQKNTMTNQATSVCQSAVCAPSNQMGARGTESSPAEMPNLLYTCKWSQIYCTSDEECVCCLWLCVWYFTICENIWSDMEKGHIWDGTYLVCCRRRRKRRKICWKLKCYQCRRNKGTNKGK